MQSSSTAATTGHAGQLESTSTILCRLIILRYSNSEALMIEQGGRHAIPSVDIPRWQRAAPHIVPAVLSRCNVLAICRFAVGVQNPEHECHYFVLDAVDSSQPATGGTVWVPVGNIAWADSESRIGQEAFYEALRQARSYDMAEPPVPFTKSRWFGEVTDWTRYHLHSQQLNLSGGWTQYNLGPLFSLIRYETDGLPVWFKAVGGPNLREYGITIELAKLHSAYLPKVLAVHPDWHGWLMLDANGHSLDETADFEHWKIAAQSLAEFQIQSVPACGSLLITGCEDQRIAELRCRVAPFLTTVARLMEMQPASPPRILTAEDLRLVGIQLRGALDEFEALGMPDTIGHSDLNPGNVQVTKDGTVFLDWMQGHVGHPFVTFEYLLALLVRLRPDREGWQTELRDIYRRSWSSVTSEAHVIRALELTPLIAPFTFAVSCTGWNEDVQNMSPVLQKVLRTLARKIYVATQRRTTSAP